MSETHPPGTPPDEQPGFSPRVIHPQDAEFLGAGSDTIALLGDASATGGLLGVSRTTLGRCRDSATPHYHRGSAYFRLLERVRHGRADPQDLLAVRDRFDTHVVDSTPWRRTRAAA
jgi:hypothetical protein